MPAPFTRHRRSSAYWDSQPSRSDEVRAAAALDPEPVKHAPAPKDTRHWCKGKPGRQHKLVVTIAENTSAWQRGDCKWDSGWIGGEVKWRCHHSEVCASCGKILRDPWQLKRSECPDYPGSAEQRAEAEAKAAESAARLRDWRARTRRVIDGPQGYRRKR